MSSPGVDRQYSDKPPAATTGSPGTAIFSPPAAQSPRPLVYTTTSSTSAADLPSSSSSTRRDPVPVQRSFDSSALWPWGNLGESPISASHITPRKELKAETGSWFGRKKDRHASKFSKLKLDRSKSVDSPATRIPRSSSPPAPSRIGSLPPTSNATTNPPTSLTAAALTSTRSTRSTNLRPLLSGISPAVLNDLPAGFPSEHTPINRTLSGPHTVTLSSIPASNSPTPHTSRPPSPTHTSSNPSHSLRPTSSHCPGSSSGSPGSHQSIPVVIMSKDKSRQRPTTSSGISSSCDAKLGGLSGGLGRVGLYGVAMSGLTEVLGTSMTSFVPSVAPSGPRSVSSITARSRKPESMAEAAKRRRMEAKARGFKMKNGKRHHPRSKEDAPYPRDYEHKTTDLDVMEHIIITNTIKRFTCHMFDTPPSKVLDLGCGTGQWILECAREWKDTHFVGFDLVPIQPKLARLGYSSLASRIEWMIGNFLEPLPFPDGEFDYVHVKYVAGGIPEDRWYAFFAEVVRVMKGGGKFEITEEDLFFPGSVVAGSDEDDDDDGGYDDGEKEDGVDQGREERKTTGTQRPPTASLSPSRPDVISNESQLSESMLGMTSMKDTKTIPPEIRISIRRTSQPHSMISYLEMRDEDDISTVVNGSDETTSTRVLSDSWMMIDQPSDASTSHRIPTGTHPSRPANPLVHDWGASLPLAHRQSHVLAQEQVPPLGQNQDLPRLSLDSWCTRRPAVGDIISWSSNANLYHEYSIPINPRDHSLLETAYNELHAARFINLTPLTILNMQLALHFKNVRSHAPIQLMFPPAPIPGTMQKQMDAESPSEAKDHVESFTTSPSRPSSSSLTTSHSRPQSFHSVTPRDVTILHIPTSDMLRPLGMAVPHREAIGFPARYAAVNTSALNIHLAARVAEVLACAEEMWEFIIECKGSPTRWQSPAIGRLAQVSREDWEDCLARYTMDMHDKIGMGEIVSNRFDWRVREGPPSAERKAFDAAILKWEKLRWEREEQEPAGKQRTARTRRTQPLSRIFRVFVAWK